MDACNTNEERSGRLLRRGLWGLLVPLVNVIILEATSITINMGRYTIRDWNLSDPWLFGITTVLFCIWVYTWMLIGAAGELDKKNDPTGATFMLDYACASIMVFVFSYAVVRVLGDLLGWLLA